MKFCILKNRCGKQICCNFCKTKDCGDRCRDDIKDCRWIEEREPKEDENIEDYKEGQQK